MYVNYPIWNRMPNVDFALAELKSARQLAVDKMAGVAQTIENLASWQSIMDEVCATRRMVEEMHARMTSPIVGALQAIEAEQRRIREAINAAWFPGFREPAAVIQPPLPAPVAPITPRSYFRRRLRGTPRPRVMRLQAEIDELRAEVNELKATLEWWEVRWFLSQLEPRHPEDDATPDK